MRELAGTTWSLFSAHGYNQYGTVRSNSATPTFDLVNVATPTATHTTLSFVNGGDISNTGTGSAISSAGTLNLSNSGTITGGSGGVAISVTTGAGVAEALILTNDYATVNGDIIVSSAAGTVSRINNVTGTINGDVRFGDGNDSYSGLLEGDRIIGLNGTLDGGAGIDTFNLLVRTDAAIGGVTLPTNFERLGLDLALSTTKVTLIADPQLSGGLSLAAPLNFNGRSTASFTIDADINATAPWLTRASESIQNMTLVNNKTINVALSSPAQPALDIVMAATNKGAINVTGGDAISSIQAFTNSGKITASGTAFTGATLSAPSTGGEGTIINSGMITSTGGSAVKLTGSRAISTNSGTITGATHGVELQAGSLLNSGAISGGSGAAILMAPGSFLANEQGGTITGNIRSKASNAFDSPARIINRGAITGAIDMSGDTGPNLAGVTLANIGGTIGGNVTLTGGNDVFTGSAGANGQLVGISGTVDAGAGTDKFIYQMRGTVTGTMTPPPSFERVGYVLFDNANVTLSAATIDYPLEVFGSGKLDVTANISGTAGPLINMAPTFFSLFDPVPAGESLSLISRGTLTLAIPAGSFDNGTAVKASGTFENAGTINVTGENGITTGIMGGSNVINSGAINIDAGYAIYGEGEVINSGTIVEAAGGPAGFGVVSGSKLTNSGSIIVDGFAAITQTSVVNSGLLEGRNGAAISTNGNVTNTSTGQIRGSVSGFNGSAIINQGSIVGDVLLGTSNPRFARTNIFVSEGTVTGNVRFGQSNDIFLQRRTTSGVSGTIDAGGGTDLYGFSFASSATYTIGAAIPATFEGEIVEAAGAATIVTLTSPTTLMRDLNIMGTGQFINQANINGNIASRNPEFYEAGTPLASFTNNATINGGLNGTIRKLVNTGTIDAAGSGMAVFVSGIDAPQFSNSGTIRSTNTNIGYTVVLSAASGADIGNSGTIAGGLSVGGIVAKDLTGGRFSINNSGTITNDRNFASALLANFSFNTGGGNDNLLTLNNSGTIQATGQASSAMKVNLPYGSRMAADITNSGTIIASGSTLNSPGNYQPAVGLFIDSQSYDEPIQVTTVRNSGSISATQAGGVAIGVRLGGLRLENSGTITGGALVAGNTVSLFGQRDFFGAAVISGDGDDFVQNSGTITGRVDLGAGSDTFVNSGQIVGDVFLRGGNDKWVQLAAATFTGLADGGEGIDTLIFDATQGGTVDGSRIGRYTNFERFEQVGNGDVSYSGTIPFDTINVNGGVVTVSVGQTLATQGSTTITGADAPVTVINGGTILGGITLGGANDAVVVNGAIVGDVALGAGNDVLVLQRATSMQVSGGTGSDTVQYAAPTGGSLMVQEMPEFENVAVSSGTALVAGSQRYDVVQVSGGQLTGQAGSSLTAATIGVMSGGSFGSAGTVNGNVVVAGTLTPGASPGTMTVNGNVALTSGSNSIFELTPTVYDQLIVSGTLAIAPGATLTLTGDRAITTGSVLDLVSAGSIAGEFTNIVRPATLQGFVVQRGARIQLFGLFSNSASFTRQVRGSIDYLNAYLSTSAGNTALLPALPVFVTSTGAISTAAFDRITPEAYASAAQIPVENGLTLIDAARNRMIASGKAEASLFSFAEGLGAWRKMSNGEPGAAPASLSSRGLVGGIGWDGIDWGVAAFIGFLDSQQTLDQIAARSDVDGYVGGVQGRFTLGEVELSGMLGFNVGDYRTRRTLPLGSARSRYDVFSGIADVSVRAIMMSGSSWQLRANAGLSYIGADRSTVPEYGAGPLALRVLSNYGDAVFASGGLEWSGRLGAGGAMQPYVSAGARHQLAGRSATAVGGFNGAPQTLMGYGVGRAPLLANASAGLRYQVSDGFSISAGYNGEWGRKDHRHGASVGMSIRM